MTKTEKIDLIENSHDVEYISDVLSELLYEKHGRRVCAMRFSIEVTFELDDLDEDLDEDLDNDKDFPPVFLWPDEEGTDG